MKKILILIVAIFTFAFCAEQKQEAPKEKEAETVKENMVREGEIKLASLDVNEDGKLWECPMDWNVIDDNAGNCTVCGMKLKEYTLEQTQANLIKHGHKVKGVETIEAMKEDSGKTNE